MMIKHEIPKLENLKLAAAIQGFEELLTETIPLEEFRQIIYESYFDFSQYVLNHPDELRYNCSTNLYWLWILAEALGANDLKDKKISKNQITQLNNLFSPVKTVSPEVAVLEISNNRTTQLEQLSFIEAETLLDSLKKAK